MGSNPIVLNYQDVILHQSDVELLNGPYWLNDNIITFYFEYLEKCAHKDDKNFLFINPDVVQCLKAYKKNELSVFLDPLNAKSKNFIFLALNNCEILDRPGGSHWSLLVYSRPEESFFHLDSTSGSNYNQAARLAGKLLSYLTPSGTGDFIELESLQQSNSYDCGIFVLCNVEFLVKKCKAGYKLSEAGQIHNHCVAEKRTHILNIISELQKKGY